jgi:hypothetical protein
MFWSAGCSLLRAEGFRIRIEGWIRICIKWIRIRNTAFCQILVQEFHHRVSPWRYENVSVKKRPVVLVRKGIQMFQSRSGRWCWFAARPATGAPPPSTWRSWAATATSRCESRPTTRRRRRYRTTTAGRILRGKTRQWRPSQRPQPARPVPVLVFQGGGGVHVFSAVVKIAVLWIPDWLMGLVKVFLHITFYLKVHLHKFSKIKSQKEVTKL